MSEKSIMKENMQWLYEKRNVNKISILRDKIEQWIQGVLI
jgi:hypothetical protein